MIVPFDAHHRSTVWSALEGCWIRDPDAPRWVGGRSEGLRRLHSYDVADYGRSRNNLAGSVSRLSPYIRHGMLTIVEVREHLRQRYAHQPERIEEFLRQLAWRDFFEKVLAWYGRGLESDLEEPKHAIPRSGHLPLDVLQGQTGLPCMDGMLHELFTEGYLHNHERLWFAAYVCHFRGVHWSEGAKLFRQYLYDGDLASNSASWQWVESTFASKPYYMNRENIASFSQNRWCRDCRVKCPFDASYPTLQHRLFGGSQAPLHSERKAERYKAERYMEGTAARPGERFCPAGPRFATTDSWSDCLSDSVSASPGLAQAEPSAEKGVAPTRLDRVCPDLVWLHDAALSWLDPALQAVMRSPTATPHAAAVTFVFDRPSLLAEPWAAHRLGFVMDGIVDVFEHVPHAVTSVRVGKLIEELSAEAERVRATTIHVSEHPNPWVVETIEGLRLAGRTVVVHPRPIFASYNDEPRRFSRYWDRVSEQVLGYRAKPKNRMHK